MAIRGASRGVPIRVEKTRNLLVVNATETGSMKHISRLDWRSTLEKEWISKLILLVELIICAVLLGLPKRQPILKHH